MEHDRSTPLDALYNMGFRTPAYEIPAASAIGGNIMDMAVNMLAANLRGGNAATMAEFLQLAIKAIEANGYGITYAVGPTGEFGLLVVPEDPETGIPDMDTNPGDYALWCEMGNVHQLMETVTVAQKKAQSTEPPTGTMDYSRTDLHPNVPEPRREQTHTECGPDCDTPF